MTIALNAFSRAQFDVSDVIRRAQGDLVGAFGLDPSECPYRIITSHSYWHLRDYGGEDQSPSLLIIAAPIKKPYIWDLTPSTSSIRFCLRQGLHVQLLEWLSASSHAGNYGIDDYVLAISEAVATSTATAKGAKPHMIGHSLGGTLAAIYGAFQPESIKVSCFWARHSVSSRRRVSFVTPLFHWFRRRFQRTSHFRGHSCRTRARWHLQIHLFGRA